jgi:membrane-bound serine protease (ClpP class)
MTALVVALLVTGASLLIAEAHVTSYGVLGAAGLAALGGAGVLAVASAGGSVVLALSLVLPVIAVLALFGVVVGHKALAVARRRAGGGADGLIGRIGVVRREVSPLGDVFVDGELWRARRSWADDGLALEEGQHIVVERVEGLTLSVRRAEEWEVLP